MNQTRLDIFKNSLLATAGLMTFAVAAYLIIQANIGVNPWDTFCIGLSEKLDILYGTASITISFSVIALDILLKEKIGIGTILDAIVVGKTVDLLNWLNLIPKQENAIIGVIMLLLGCLIAGFAQYLYMKAGLSCGPRDGFQIAIGRRLHMIPIGGVNVIILSVVLVIGWLLDGPIGIGTLLSPFLMGFTQQLAFNLMKFEPKEVVHQDLFGSAKVLLGKRQQKEN